MESSPQSDRRSGSALKPRPSLHRGEGILLYPVGRSGYLSRLLVSDTVVRKTGGGDGLNRFTDLPRGY